MAEDIFQSLWIGEHMTTIERLSIASFLANGHKYILYLYRDVKDVPDKVLIKDANEIIDEKYIFSSHRKTYAAFSDWFRHELLRKKGGYWVDTDVVCLKPFDFDEDFVFGYQYSDSVGAGVIKIPKGHEVTEQLSQICMRPNTILPYDSFEDKKRKLIRKYLKLNRRRNIKWGEAGGPEGFTKALKYNNLISYAKPFTCFYPIHFSCWKSAFDETFKTNTTFFENSYSIHLWNDKMRREKNFDKNGTFEKESLIEKLKRRYL